MIKANEHEKFIAKALISGFYSTCDGADRDFYYNHSKHLVDTLCELEVYNIISSEVSNYIMEMSTIPCTCWNVHWGWYECSYDFINTRLAKIEKDFEV